MQIADVEARKIVALQKSVRGWLDTSQPWFDPSLVSDLFDRYLTSRDRLRRWMPEVFGDLPDRKAVPEALFEDRTLVPREQLMALHHDLEYCLGILIAYAGQGKEVEGPSAVDQNMSRTDPANVFVIHGRNDHVRKAMFEFLRAIGLKPLEWLDLLHSTGHPTPYIGEVLNRAFERAQAVVALLTPDDLVTLHPRLRTSHDAEYETRLTGQARPNVLFETGMALGRAPERTVIVTVGDIRPFSDISGLHTVRLTNSVATRQSLAARLQSCGCPVNVMTQSDWHYAGDFEVSMMDHALTTVHQLIKEATSNLPLGKGASISKQGIIELAVRHGVSYSEALQSIDLLIERNTLTPMMIAGVEEYMVHDSTQD